MPGVKKLAVVVSVLVTGASTALFFRKDASQFSFRQEASAVDPFRQRIERRVTSDAAWNSSLRSGASRPQQALRVAPTTAAIPQGVASQSQPTFQKSFNPVGALLEPIDAAPEAIASDGPASIEPIAPSQTTSSLGTLAHQIVDGDTLSKLAAQYLGSAERYREIYELNREVLTNPDLLPIGKVLKIPPKLAPSSSPGEPESAPAASDAESGPLELVPVPAADEPAGS